MVLDHQDIQATLEQGCQATQVTLDNLAHLPQVTQGIVDHLVTQVIAVQVSQVILDTLEQVTLATQDIVVLDFLATLAILAYPLQVTLVSPESQVILATLVLVYQVTQDSQVRVLQDSPVTQVSQDNLVILDTLEQV